MPIAIGIDISLMNFDEQQAKTLLQVFIVKFRKLAAEFSPAAGMAELEFLLATDENTVAGYFIQIK